MSDPGYFIMKISNPLSKHEIQNMFLLINKRKYLINFSDPEFREKAISYNLPKYILPTEFIILLNYLPDLYQTCLISTLWHTGARITEVVNLTRKSFVLKPPYPYIKIENHNDMPISHFLDRPVNTRQVPLFNIHYVVQIKKMTAQLNILKNKYYINTEKKELWNVNKHDVIYWIDQAVEKAKYDGISFPVNITLDSIKNSFIMRMLTVGIDPFLLQQITDSDDCNSQIKSFIDRNL